MSLLDREGLEGKDSHLFLQFGGALTSADDRMVSQSPASLVPVSAGSEFGWHG